MAVTLFAVNNGYLDGVEVTKALSFESALRAFLKGNYAALMDKIEAAKDLDAESEKQLTGAIQEFKKTATY
jgi:F-type H+-transporting ATPase subunit alpha